MVCHYMVFKLSTKALIVVLVNNANFQVLPSDSEGLEE